MWSPFFMITDGQLTLKNADWLLGFDFDGTLADIDDQYSVSHEFFEEIEHLKKEHSVAWGICTGRSLEFLKEGMNEAKFPFYPDYLVTQERDIYYRSSESSFAPDQERNLSAKEALLHTLEKNKATLDKVKSFIDNDTNGEWISILGDPAGIIATSEREIQEAVDIYKECSLRSKELDYQRNTIYLRFTHRDFCKGTAIQYLQSLYEFKKENTLVMGDNFNDLTMLNPSVASHFGGPKNSIDELKATLLSTGGFIEDRRCSYGVIDAIKRVI